MTTEHATPRIRVRLTPTEARRLETRRQRYAVRREVRGYRSLRLRNGELK